MLSKSQILAAKTLKTAEIEVPEWDGSVTIRELTAGAARHLFSQPDDLMPVLWVILSVIDENGAQQFTEADLKLFDDHSQAAIRRISNAAIKLNGLGQTEEDKTKN